MRYVLGIDQGASKTYAMVADERGGIVGFGQSAGACHSTNGMEKAVESATAAASAALAQAGCTIEDIRHVTAGATGVDWPGEAELVARHFASALRCPLERVQVVNDCIIALRAGTRKDSGCVLCAGSGLNCAVVKDRRVEVIFGFYIPDEDQGGAALGRRTLRAVFDAQMDLIPPTALTQELLSYFRAQSVDELLHRYVDGGVTPQEVLYLPMLLERAAAQNDRVALDILEQYGKTLARYAVAGLRKADMLDADIDVVLSGSILKCRIPVLKETVAAQIHRHAGRARIVDSYLEPVVGAVLMGLDKLYDVLPQSLYDRIEADARQMDLVRCCASN